MLPRVRVGSPELASCHIALLCVASARAVVNMELLYGIATFALTAHLSSFSKARPLVLWS